MHQLEGNVSNGGDCSVLQDTLLGVAFCDLAQELGLVKIDPEWSKVFRIAQLTIRYLLHTQEVLTTTLKEMKSDNELAHQVPMNEMGKLETAPYLFMLMRFFPGVPKTESKMWTGPAKNQSLES